MKNAPENGLIKGDDGKWRCWWHGNDAQYLQYHDDEWGHIVTDDKRLFEKITLEGFQAGLSWLTILRKRENFRQAFDHFDFIKIARYTQKDIECLLSNAGIIRHRGKIEAAINNAKAVQNIIEEFGSFSHYIWQYDMVNVVRPDVIDFNYLKTQTTSDLSVALSKDLKKRGFKFVGPTTCYAFMQSMGLVNDHVEGCICRVSCANKRSNFENSAL